MSESIAIIGAGPKALSIAIKNQILSRLGFAVPQLHIFEQHAVGAHWVGQFGYTDGQFKLGTSPEKDLCFPYDTRCYGELADAVLTQAEQFSWAHYLRLNGRYAAWIDRGKPAPSHRQWAAYFAWSAAQLSTQVSFHFERVDHVAIANHGWRIQTADAEYRADALVLTGPGKPMRAFHPPDSPRILDAKNFWQSVAHMTISDKSRIAVVGAGENAASMLMTLNQQFGDRIAIDVFTRQATLLSRGESYFENRLFTQAEDWAELPEESRKKFSNCSPNFSTRGQIWATHL